MKHLFFIVVACLTFASGSIRAQQTGMGAPGERRGTGTVVLRAAATDRGTGAAPIRNGIVVVTDNKITAVGTSEASRYRPELASSISATRR